MQPEFALDEAVKQLDSAICMGRPFVDACTKISSMYGLAYDELSRAYGAWQAGYTDIEGMGL